MQTEQTFESIFGVAIHVYTRGQALEDGVLVDVTTLAREAGFRIPVAMSYAVWADAVEWNEADSQRQTPQDQESRLWDVLWMAYLAARSNAQVSRKALQLLRIPRDGRHVRPRLTILHMQIGPGDEGEPVITIMMPDEY
ncbi:DUF6573 family protein [Comamonas sp.]